MKTQVHVVTIQYLMLSLLLALSLTSCGPGLAYKACPSSVFFSVAVERDTWCARTERNAVLAQKMLTEFKFGKKGDWENASVIIEYLGGYDPNGRYHETHDFIGLTDFSGDMKISPGEHAMLHEMIHSVRIHQMKPGEYWHVDWEELGYNALSDEYQKIIWGLTTPEDDWQYDR